MKRSIILVLILVSLIFGQLPTVTTNAATGITTTTATLNGTVNANGNTEGVSVGFEWGLTTMYGLGAMCDQGGVDGTTNTAVTLTIIDLSPNTTYHYRVVANTEEFGSTPGSDMTFTTLASNPFAGGDGTAGNPYQITNIDQLQDISLYLDAHYIIMNDIDASATTTWNSGAGFVPIGTYFTGTLDGQNFTVSDLYIYNTIDYGGLFGVLDSASVSNIILENIDITGADLTGSLAGTSSYSNISNCHSSGTVNSIESSMGTGGLIGMNDEGSIENSHSSCDVTGFSKIGGFVGVCQGDINNSYSSGYVLSTSAEIAYAGGFAGVISGGNVSNCYSSGDITSTVDYCGGFASIIDSYISEVTLTNCYSTGFVTGNFPIGGFIGGYPSKKVKTTISNCYWDTDSSGQATSAGGTGKTTAEMNYQFTFTGWDFISEITNGTDDYWGINPSDNSGYPFLSWQGYDPIIFPEVTTLAVTDITKLTATGNGTLNSLGIPNPAAHGLCWNTSGSPTLADDFTDDGTAGSTGSYSTPMIGFLPKTMYYVRAYATNSAGTSYGNEVNFTTLPFDGTGTEIDPYQITNVDQLQDISLYLDADYIIINDIDASATTTWNSGAGFVPMGTLPDRFTGTLDAQNFTISDLYINNTESQTGLFGVTNVGSMISNLILENVDITAGAIYTGSIAGISMGVVINCHTSGAITSTGSLVGGFVGEIGITGEIYNSHSTCSATGYSLIGGFTGSAMGYCEIIGCFSTGNVTGSINVGGFVGKASGGGFSNCYSFGDATSDNSYCGGFAGAVETDENFNEEIIFTNCYSTGTVTGAYKPGGFIGQESDEYGKIAILNCYWDKDTSGQTISEGGTGKTTSEMKDRSTFVGWDFYAPVWGIDSLLNNGYPFLNWQDLEALGIPLNITTSINGSNIEIAWDPVEVASSYIVYASYNPYSDFSDLSPFGTFDGTTWTIPFIGDKMFFYVVSSSEENKSTPIENVTPEMIREYLKQN